MRCPSCDARNVEQAGWCTQCFASLTIVSDPGPASAAPGVGTTPVAVPRPAVGDAVTVAGDIRQRDDEVEWRCRRCDGWAPLVVASCTTCGTARHGFGEPHDPASTREVSVGTAVAGSLLLPGLGHVLLGAVGAGAARIGLWLLWAGAGMGGLGSGAGGGRTTGVILLAGAVVLWVTSAVDAAALGSGARRPWLGGRRFVVLVVAVTGGLLLAAMLTAFGAVG